MTTSDEEAIQAVLSGYYDAIGRNSAAASAFYSEPTAVLFPNQLLRFKSRAELTSFFDQLVASLKPSGFSHSELAECHVRLLNSTTALCSAVANRMKEDGTV